MIGEQIHEEAVDEWSKMKLTEASKAMSYSATQNHHFQLKYSEQLSIAARGDLNLKEEVKQFREGLKARDDEKKKLLEMNRKLKI